MTDDPKLPSDVAAAQVRALRERRGWTAHRLAERCAEVGAPKLTALVIANIETGRRDDDGRRRRNVTVDELLALALALGVPPVLLLLPVGVSDALAVTGTVAFNRSGAAVWLCGDEPPETPPNHPAWKAHRPAVDTAQWQADTLHLRLYRTAEALGHQLWRAVDLEWPATDQAEVARDFARALNHLTEAGLTVPPFPVPESLADQIRRVVTGPDNIIPVKQRDEGANRG